VTLTTRQEARYQGNDWWQWSVWVDGPAEELAQVKAVTYYLHSTFPKPERRVESATTQFRLDSAGWGEFTLRVVIEKTNGEKNELFHDLILPYPPGADAAALQRGEPPIRVFLSYSTLDERLAENVRRLLGSHDIEVLDPTDIGPGQDVSSEIVSKVGKADYVVALLTDRTGKSVMSEIATAMKNRTPVIAVEVGHEHPPAPEGASRIPLRDENDVSAFDSLVEQIRPR
jgi:hypothetical protein